MVLTKTLQHKRSLNYYADIENGLFTHLISFKMFSLNLLYDK